jgi:hypothetical protein
MDTNKMLSAMIAVVSLLTSAVQLFGADLTEAVSTDARVQPLACPKDVVWENRTFQQTGWKATIILDPCVPESHAMLILQSIEQQHLVNAQPANRSTGAVPAVPTVRLSQVEWIGARWASGGRVDGSDAGPFELYEVRTRSLDSPLRGLSLRVSIRSGAVEVRAVGTWFE